MTEEPGEVFYKKGCDCTKTQSEARFLPERGVVLKRLGAPAQEPSAAGCIFGKNATPTGEGPLTWVLTF